MIHQLYVSCTFSPKVFVFFISGIKTWRLSSLTSTWCLITAKSSMKTIQKLVELVITWGSSLRSAGLSFWNKQTKSLFRFSPIKPFNFSYRSTRFYFCFYFLTEKMALQDGRRRSQILNKEARCVLKKDVTLEKKKSHYMRCAGFITTGIKAPKSPREMGCRSAIPFPVSEHCTEWILNCHWCVCARILSTTCK